MKEEVSKAPSSPNHDDQSKPKRPYVTPAIESYGSVSGVTQGLLQGKGSKDTLVYSY